MATVKTLKNLIVEMLSSTKNSTHNKEFTLSLTPGLLLNNQNLNELLKIKRLESFVIESFYNKAKDFM